MNTVPENFRIVPSDLSRVDELARVQREAYPELNDQLWFLAEHYASHIRQFPEGQFTLLAPDGSIAGAATTARAMMAEGEIEHTYNDKLGTNHLYKHDPGGEWLYLADICVHPSRQGLGLTRLLFGAMKDYVRAQGMKGIVFGGVLRNYGAVKDKMSAAEYVAKIKAGEIYDPTVNVHLKRGFEIRGIIDFYFEAPAYDNKAAFFVWKYEP